MVLGIEKNIRHSDVFTGPSLTDDMIRLAESKLGVRLPQAYLETLRIVNGGSIVDTAFFTPFKTSWSAECLEVSQLLGIGGRTGIDGEMGSEYLIGEWGYPDVGVVIFVTAAAGPDTVMLDYRGGAEKEPGVVYVDESRRLFRLTDSFEDFMLRLEPPLVGE